MSPVVLPYGGAADGDVLPPVLLAGTGAMACLFAARLSAAGVPVSMIGSWAEGLYALKHHGVRLSEASGEENNYPVCVVEEPQSCGQYSMALVLVKSWQTPSAAARLARCLLPGAAVLTLQNGMGNREALASVLVQQEVFLGTTTTGATLLGPGHVRAGGEGVVSVGDDPAVRPWTELLARAGFRVETVPDPNVLLWGKLVINAAINPLTALLRVPNGELLERPSARSLMYAAAQEAAAVAVAKGIELPYPDPAEAAEKTARRTAQNLSSMLQDVLRVAPTEIDAINGAIAQAGDETGVPAPINWTLWSLVKALGAP